MNKGYEKSVQMWGCIHYKGPGAIAFYSGRLNGDKYRELIREPLGDTYSKLDLSFTRTLFQQDNAPCHQKDDNHQRFFDLLDIKKLE